MSKGILHNSQLFKADRREDLRTQAARTFFSTSADVSVEDVFLKPGKTLHFKKEQHPFLLIPLVGSVELDTGRLKSRLDSEQILVNGRDEVVVVNPYTKEDVNFLKVDLHRQKDVTRGTAYLQLDKRNSLIVASGIDRTISVGVFDSRTKGRYAVSKNAKGVYAFVINGSFEVEERLVEHRDGLTLNDVQEIEFEALSELALLLLIEF